MRQPLTGSEATHTDRTAERALHDEQVWQLYCADTPQDVFATAWSLLQEQVHADAAALWELDTDSQVFVRSHYNLSSQLQHARLPKMDCAIGKVLVETGEPLYVGDVTAHASNLDTYPPLTAPERQALAGMDMRSILIVPAGKRFVLTCFFSSDPGLSDQDIARIQEIAVHMVQAYAKAQEAHTNRILVQLGQLLSSSPDTEPETLDNAARLARDLVSAGGVSIFLKHPYDDKLVLAGTTGISEINGREDYEKITYGLKPGEGLTSDVFLKGRPFRWPDLDHPHSPALLAGRGLTWRKRWNEVETFQPGATKAIIVIPMTYRRQDGCAEQQEERVGVIRAAIRTGSEVYFSPEDEAALAEVARILGQHVGAVRRRDAESLDSMQRIAHQFVSPLTAMLWAVDELRAKYKGDQRVESLQELALLAAAMGQNFELIARLFGGQWEALSPQPTRLAPVVIRTARNYQPLARSAGVRIYVAEGNDSGSLDWVGNVLVDPAAFSQALMNVIDNAIKYGRPGTQVTLTAKRDKWSRVELLCTGVSRLRICKQDVESIFRKGWRSRDARRIALAGTGTGLWLAREIMRRHGGDLTTQPSEPVRGGGHRVVFRFILKGA